jgi:hypothetical protein
MELDGVGFWGVCDDGVRVRHGEVLGDTDQCETQWLEEGGVGGEDNCKLKRRKKQEVG